MLKLLDKGWLPLLVALLGLALWGQHQRLELVGTKLKAAEDAQQQTSTALTALDKRARANASEAAKLRANLAATQQRLTLRDQQWEQLKHDNADLKAWAQSVLPAAVRQLHQRPAFTGADAYQQWLSQAQPLHPAAGQPQEQ